jgi:3-oxoacid CoA-transferase
MGGSMDLVSAPHTKVVVAMYHMTKDGKKKVVEACNLPITGKHCVHLLITEMVSVLDVSRISSQQFNT